MLILNYDYFSGSSIAYPVDTSKPSMQMDYLIAPRLQPPGATC